MSKSTSQKYYSARGGRKRATARVRLYMGKGQSTINGKPVDEVYASALLRERLTKPIVVVGLSDKVYFTAKVMGGGISSQLDAVQLGIARAILLLDEDKKSELRKGGFVTRDPRKKERKKYYHRKARKSPQFSKR